MAEQKKQQTQEQDLNHLLKVRREKLASFRRRERIPFRSPNTR